MIGLISSTIFAPIDPVYGEQRSRFSHEERLSQTIETIASLRAARISDIYLADNSGRAWQQTATAQITPARLLLFDQFPFRNKGISEAYLLLSALRDLPEDQPIFKISGRYKLIDSIPELGDADLAVKLGSNASSLSTRAYVVRNRAVLDRFLRATLQEMFGHGSRIVGPRSLMRILGNALRPSRDSYCYYDPSVGLEIAAAMVLKRNGWKIRQLPTLGIEGRYATICESVSE